MEANRKAHPECVHASNPYHECASACLERIANGKGRKDVKKQASKLTSVGSFGKKKKEIESRPKTPQNGSLATNRNRAKDPTMTPLPITKKSPVHENKLSSSEEEEQSRNFYAQDDSFKPRQGRLSGSVVVSANNTPDHHKQTMLKPTDHEITEEKSDTTSFDFVSRPTSQDNHVNNNNNKDDDDNDDDDDDEVESVISDSWAPVGKYHVKSAFSSILQSIIDKHGDIAANCMLESASMRARYLECLCLVVEELQSTPFERLTKLKVKEMLAVLKDLETVNISVDWLRSVLDELLPAVEVKTLDHEMERRKGVMASLAAELEALEEDLVQKEKEAAEARARLDETRARLRELEEEQSRLDGIQDKVEKFRRKSYMDNVI